MSIGLLLLPFSHLLSPYPIHHHYISIYLGREAGLSLPSFTLRPNCLWNFYLFAIFMRNFGPIPPSSFRYKLPSNRTVYGFSIPIGINSLPNFGCLQYSQFQPSFAQLFHYSFQAAAPPSSSSFLIPYSHFPLPFTSFPFRLTVFVCLHLPPIPSFSRSSLFHVCALPPHPTSLPSPPPIQQSKTLPP